MCAIAGEIYYEPCADPYFREVSLQDIELVNQRQYQRGPDSSGLYQLGNLVLGHRRLKIFDLTDRAA